MVLLLAVGLVVFRLIIASPQSAALRSDSGSLRIANLKGKPSAIKGKLSASKGKYVEWCAIKGKLSASKGKYVEWFPTNVMYEGSQSPSVYLCQLDFETYHRDPPKLAMNKDLVKHSCLGNSKTKIDSFPR